MHLCGATLSMTGQQRSIVRSQRLHRYSSWMTPLPSLIRPTLTCQQAQDQSAVAWCLTLTHFPHTREVTSCRPLSIPIWRGFSGQLSLFLPISCTCHGGAVDGGKQSNWQAFKGKEKTHWVQCRWGKIIVLSLSTEEQMATVSKKKWKQVNEVIIILLIYWLVLVFKSHAAVMFSFMHSAF